MATGSFKLPISSGSSEWVRPSDWLPMPTVTAANDTFVGLYAIFPEGGNGIALRFTTSTGQYRVDWGDGTVTLHNTNTTAQYEYNYATINNSTLSSRGYKQVLVTVTPVSGILRTLDLAQRFVTSPQLNNLSTSHWLDVIISMPGATGMTWGSVNYGNRYVERVRLLSIGTITDIRNFFRDFSRLQSVTMPSNTSGLTVTIGLFGGCYMLQNVPLFNTSNVTNMGSMFLGCVSLRTVPLFDTSKVIFMDAMFQNSGITEIPLFNTPLLRDTINMFSGCSWLRTVPLFNMSEVLSANNMFFSCVSLQSVPLFNTSKVTNMTNWFQSCASLQNIPAFNTAAITPSAGSDFSNFATNAYSIDRIQVSFARTVSIQNCQLSSTALVEVFNNLANRSATTSATITISGNWGATNLTAGERAIATGKNWVIVG